MEQQSIGKTYSQIIKFGRLLENHQLANEMADDKPEIILAFVSMVDKQLRFTSVDDFFTLFPPIKRYADDGIWDYNSTLAMRRERLGSHFGKDDFKHLIMSSCYENKWLQLVGISFIWSISRAYERNTGKSMMLEFFNK